MIDLLKIKIKRVTNSGGFKKKRPERNRYKGHIKKMITEIKKQLKKIGEISNNIHKYCIYKYNALKK